MSSYSGPDEAEADWVDVIKSWPQISFTCPPSWSNEPLSTSGICIVSCFAAKAIFNLFGCRSQLFSLQKKPSRCYVKRQWRVCIAFDPKNMQFLLVWEAPVRHCHCIFGRFSCVLIGTQRQDEHTEQGRNDRHLNCDTLSVQQAKKKQKNVE